MMARLLLLLGVTFEPWEDPMNHRSMITTMTLTTILACTLGCRDEICRDEDGDGYESCSDVPGLVDCDDGDPTVHPRADEVACDGIDQDCDGVDRDPATVAWTFPADGEAGVHPRTFLNAGFADVDDPDELPEVDLWLVANTGEVVHGDVQLHRSEVWFSPEAELAPQRTYSATLAVGRCEPHEWSFDTGETGLEVDPTAAVGGDYFIDHMSGRVSTPLSMGGLIEEFAAEIDAALHVTAVDEATGTFEAFSAVVEWDGDVLVQDLCQVTAPWAPGGGAPAAWDNPHFHTGEFDWSFGQRNGNHDPIIGHAQGVLASGTVATDGSRIDGLRIDEMVEMEFLDEAYWNDEDPGSCELFASLGEPCVECPDGSGPHCMHIIFELIDAPRTTVETVDPPTGELLQTLIEVSAEDVAQRQVAGVCP
jgi:hypothetical protein